MISGLTCKFLGVFFRLGSTVLDVCGGHRAFFKHDAPFIPSESSVRCGTSRCRNRGGNGIFRVK